IYDICKQSFKLKDNESEVKFIISLCVALKIIESFSFKDKKLYTCINYERLYRNETTTNLLSVSRRLRLTCLSKLLYIEEFKEAIRKVTD
ncbi:TPA: retron St85 family effector protein, partial [Vibrio alginolyticus]